MQAGAIIEAVIYSPNAFQFGKWLEASGISFTDVLKNIHPDVCKLMGAQDAMVRALEFRKELDQGTKHEDDSGEIIYKFDSIQFNGDKNILKYSFDCRTKLPNSDVFDKYLPATMDSGKFNILIKNRALPIAHLPNPLDQKHLNWIASRMFEFVAWLNSKNIVHAGINPDTIWVVPETHGIVIPTFYHMSERNGALITISAKWNRFYPEHMVKNKIASRALDVELIKRTMCWLAGDSSGIGNVLKGKINKDWLNFMTTFHDISAFEVFKLYRKLIDTNFPKAFHRLDI